MTKYAVSFTFIEEILNEKLWFFVQSFFLIILKEMHPHVYEGKKQQL